MHESLTQLTRDRHPLTRPGGERLWRSVGGDETPFEIGEFAPGADLPPDEPTRRRFMQIMGASIGLAGLSACTRQPSETIVPYIKQPEKVVPGRPAHYATALTLGGFGRGVIMTTYEGRPVKVEGNPDHPASGGATGVIDQARVLELYDPDRSQLPRRGGRVSTWGRFEAYWSRRAAALDRNGGRSLAIITADFTSPTLIEQIERLLDRWPEAAWCVHEPTLRQNPRRPWAVHHLRQAQRMVVFDDDLLVAGPGAVRLAREFADGRRMREGRTQMNRLYVAEPMPTVTGSQADHRLPIARSRIAALVMAISDQLSGSTSQTSLTDHERRWLDAVIDDLVQHRGHSLIVAGPAQPVAVHEAVMRLNNTLENTGNNVEYVAPFDAAAHEAAHPIDDLPGAGVDTLVMIGVNPVYDAPIDMNFAERLERVEHRIHFGLYFDETAERCDWHLPAAHELESWSDTRSDDGAVTIMQPMIRPLYDGRSIHELLLLLGGESDVTGHEALRTRWRAHTGIDEGAFDRWWRRVLHDGVIADSAAPVITLDVSASTAPLATKSSAELELVMQPDPHVFDGRFANNGWLQELPEPMSKLVWGNAALLSPATAKTHGIDNGDVIELAVGGRRIEAAAWIMPGVAEHVVAVHLGHGRTAAGRVGNGVGFNAYPLRTTTARWHAGGLKLRKLGRRHPLTTTQHHQSPEGRGLLRHGTLDEFTRDPEHIAHPHGKREHHTLMPTYNTGEHQWGMVIDLTACIGCGACTIACQAENNIPVVGETEVRRGRLMHWIRVDRYFEGHPDDPKIHHQPVPCMQCEHAPCEVVCPTGATQHTEEGLNAMIYNRCVGTRYCSNNCPYKVRRFNFFDYVQAEKQPEVVKMRPNPNVTIRSRGVMEKCTYCVQRIEAARIDAMNDRRTLGGDEVTPACAGACPSQAIAFGDLRQPGSRVSKLYKEPHQYGMLTELNTYPRTRYLGAVRNPNPALEGDPHA